MSSPPRIAIIGGGPAGCTLARLLLNASIPVTVFEGETSLAIRAQGGTLDLHTATGLKALKEVGAYEEFLKYARFDGEAIAFADKNLKYLIRMGGSSANTSRGRPEIDRVRLREILVKTLPPDTIRWGCRLRSIDDDLSLHFDHGVEKGYDLVVGADGAWSKVRPLLSSVRPVYAGLGGVNLIIKDVENRYPDIHKLVNRGSLFVYSDAKGLIAQQKGDGSINIYVWSPRDEDWIKTCRYDVRNAKEVKKAFLQEYEAFCGPLLEMIQVASDEDFSMQTLYELPVGHRWKSRPGATLIGDAAHLSTPFAGEGVNIAMQDAMLLSQAIISATKEDQPTEALNRNLKIFEEDMFRRGKAVQEYSKANMVDMYFVPGAPATTIDRYVRRGIFQDWKRYLIPLWAIRLLLRVLLLFSK